MRKLLLFTLLIIGQFLPFGSYFSFCIGIQIASAQYFDTVEFNDIVVIGHHDEGYDDDWYDDDWPTYEELFGIENCENNDDENGTNDMDDSSYYNPSNNGNTEEIVINTIFDVGHKNTFWGSVPLDAKVGNENFAIEVSTHCKLYYNMTNKTYSLEVMASSSNAPISAGSIRGAFCADLVINGKTISHEDLSPHSNAYISPSIPNFNGEAVFQNVDISVKSIEVNITGNWIVDAVGGRAVVTLPGLLGVFAPLKYEHTYKIK